MAKNMKKKERKKRGRKKGRKERRKGGRRKRIIFRVCLKTRIYLLPRVLAFLTGAPFLSIDACLSNHWLLHGEQQNLD